MPKHSNGKERKLEMFGYCPMNVGYQPDDDADFIPWRPGSDLPMPPEGGTGESPAPSTDSESNKTSR